MRVNQLPIVLLLSMNMLMAGCSDRTRKDELSNTNKPADTVRYEYASYEEGAKLFADLNYTPEAWQSGVREIPNLRIAKVPDRWRNKTSNEIEVKLKKQIFFRIIAPLALTVNKEIKSDREELKQFIDKGFSGLSEDEVKRLKQMALDYKVINADADIKEDDLNELCPVS